MPINWGETIGYGAYGAGIGTSIAPGVGTAIGAGIGAGAGILKGLLEPSTEVDYKRLENLYRRIIEGQHRKIFRKREEQLKREYQRRGLYSSGALTAALSRLKAGEAEGLTSLMDKLALQRMTMMGEAERARKMRELQQYEKGWEMARAGVQASIPPKAGVSVETLSPETKQLLWYNYQRALATGDTETIHILESAFPEVIQEFMNLQGTVPLR
jgi:hypothetical protein